MLRQDSGSLKASVRLSKDILRVKKCPSCEELKSHDCFYKSKQSKDGLRHYCRQCENEKNKLSYRKRALKVSVYGREYRKQNKEKIKEQKAKRYKITIKGQYQNKREHINSVRMERYRNRIKTDINFRIEKSCRGRIYAVLKKCGAIKSAETELLIGCDIDSLISHIQSLFTHGMTWDNYGKWHIDHIIPCAVFDLTDKKEQKSCFHYSNLQPLWAIDNLKKKDKLIWDQHR